MLRATWSIKIDQICSNKLRRFHILIVPTDTETEPDAGNTGSFSGLVQEHYGMHYGDVIMGTTASQITSRTVVYSTVYSDADQRKKSKLRVTGICVGNSPGTGEFPAQMASYAENVSIWWRHHGYSKIATVTELKHSKFQELYPRFTVSRGFGADAVRSVQVTFTHIFHSDINGA